MKSVLVLAAAAAWNYRRVKVSTALLHAVAAMAPGWGASHAASPVVLDENVLIQPASLGAGRRVLYV